MRDGTPKRPGMIRSLKNVSIEFSPRGFCLPILFKPAPTAGTCQKDECKLSNQTREESSPVWSPYSEPSSVLAVIHRVQLATNESTPLYSPSLCRFGIWRYRDVSIAKDLYQLGGCSLLVLVQGQGRVKFEHCLLSLLFMNNIWCRNYVDQQRLD